MSDMVKALLGLSFVAQALTCPRSHKHIIGDGTVSSELQAMTLVSTAILTGLEPHQPGGDADRLARNPHGRLRSGADIDLDRNEARAAHFNALLERQGQRPVCRLVEGQDLRRECHRRKAGGGILGNALVWRK